MAALQGVDANPAVVLFHLFAECAAGLILKTESIPRRGQLWPILASFRSIRICGRLTCQNYNFNVAAGPVERWDATGRLCRPDLPAN